MEDEVRIRREIELLEQTTRRLAERLGTIAGQLEATGGAGLLLDLKEEALDLLHRVRDLHAFLPDPDGVDDNPDGFFARPETQERLSES